MNFLNEYVVLIISLFSFANVLHIFIYAFKGFLSPKQLDIQQVEVTNFKR